MDDKVIQRIDGVLKHIDKIKKELNGVSFEEFSKSTLLVDAMSFSIAQIGERMIKLEELLRDKYPNLPWVQARRMRNIIVHDYDNSDPMKVYKTATNDMDDLKTWFLIIKDDIKHISDNSIKTERLLLRPWDDLDADELYELAKEPEIGYWCGWEPHKSIRDSLFFLHNFLEVKETYAVCLKDSGRIIGSISLTFDGELIKNEDECELGFWIGKEYQNNGFAFEATIRIIDHAFNDLKMNKIWCECFEGNYKSLNMQEKLHFDFERYREKTDAINANQKQKRCVNSLIKEKWLNPAFIIKLH